MEDFEFSKVEKQFPRVPAFPGLAWNISNFSHFICDFFNDSSLICTPVCALWGMKCLWWADLAPAPGLKSATTERGSGLILEESLQPMC